MRASMLKEYFPGATVKFKVKGDDVTLFVTNIGNPFGWSLTIPVIDGDLDKTFRAAIDAMFIKVNGYKPPPF